MSFCVFLMGGRFFLDDAACWLWCCVKLPGLRKKYSAQKKGITLSPYIGLASKSFVFFYLVQFFVPPDEAVVKEFVTSNLNEKSMYSYC